MADNIAQILDPGALTIVLAGSALATIARCGWRDVRFAGLAFLRLWGSRFNEQANRRSLAQALRVIEKEGPLCAEVALPPDPALSRLIAAYLKSGSHHDMQDVRRREQAHRKVQNATAVQTFEYAGELAPIFGLVGTLFAITQLAPTAGLAPDEAIMASISTAVLSSLYGVLTAHLLYLPLARAIERQHQKEEEARAALLDWIDSQLSISERTHPTHLRDAA